MDNILKKYDKNRKKHLLKEVTGTGAVGTFVGRKGDYIDKKFSGGFHPKFGELKKLLKKQVEGDIIKRLFSDDKTPMAERDFIDLEYDYKYDKALKIDKSKFKNTSETDMQLVDMEIDYDKIEDNTEKNKKFINDTCDWKSIYDSKKY
jgi:tRNA U34 5-carboxymethylaminomethyl modifying enzyme MnmG/GidA